MANYFDQYDVPASSPPDAGQPGAVSAPPVAAAPGNYFDQYDAAQTPNQRVAEDFGQFPVKQPSFLEVATKPITSYPEVYAQMRGQAGADIAAGLSRALGSEAPISEQAKGLGQAALGTAGYVLSPINAAYRTLVGQPVQDVTGIPAPWVDFAAQLATPGIGLTSLPGRAAAAAGKAAAPTTQQLLDAFGAAKRSPVVEAVQIRPEAAGKISDVIQAELSGQKFSESRAPQTFGLLNEIKANMAQAPKFQMQGLTSAGPIAPGAPPPAVTMANIDDIRYQLGLIAKGNSPDAAAAQIAKKRLDSWVDSGIPKTDVLAGDPAAAQQVMQAARADYTAGKLSEALDKRIAKAEDLAGGEHSGLNLGNKLRQKVGQFLDSPDSRALSDAERETMKQFVQGSTAQNVLRYVGNFLGGGGGLGSAFMAVSTGGMSAPVGLGLRMLSNSLTSRQADRLSELLRSRSPLGQQMQASMDSWSKYAQAAQTAPSTPRILAMLTIQSRNLANNLRDAGIMVTPDNIMRSLTGPIPGAAQEQQ
jgi:hypothetical protein